MTQFLRRYVKPQFNININLMHDKCNTQYVFYFLQHVKQFYSMNKSPFLEWLKRIRSEIIETCLLSREYPLAYFNAALIANSQKMEHVLFCTNGKLRIVSIRMKLKV